MIDRYMHDPRDLGSLERAELITAIMAVPINIRPDTSIDSVVDSIYYIAWDRKWVGDLDELTTARFGRMLQRFIDLYIELLHEYRVYPRVYVKAVHRYNEVVLRLRSRELQHLWYKGSDRLMHEVRSNRTLHDEQHVRWCYAYMLRSMISSYIAIDESLSCTIHSFEEVLTFMMKIHSIDPDCTTCTNHGGILGFIIIEHLLLRNTCDRKHDMLLAMLRHGYVLKYRLSNHADDDIDSIEAPPALRKDPSLKCCVEVILLYASWQATHKAQFASALATIAARSHVA